MDATLIIPQFGRADLTLQCLRTLRQHEPTSWPVLIVDDGSPDDSARQIEDALAKDLAARRPSLFPATLLRRPHRGLSAAWNHAAGVARTPVLVFLNNDVLVEGPFVERLIAPLRPHSMAPRRNGRPLARLAGTRMRSERRLPEALIASLPTTRFLEGWCFAARRHLFRALRGFDESMRLYWSDTDLQCRIVAEARSQAEARPTGSVVAPPNERSLIAVPDLPLRHLGHQTTHAQPQHGFQWRRDRAAFVRKWSTATANP